MSTNIVGRVAFGRLLAEALGHMTPEKVAEVNAAHVRWVSRFEDRSWAWKADLKRTKGNRDVVR